MVAERESIVDFAYAPSGSSSNQARPSRIRTKTIAGHKQMAVFVSRSIGCMPLRATETPAPGWTSASSFVWYDHRPPENRPSSEIIVERTRSMPLACSGVGSGAGPISHFSVISCVRFLSRTPGKLQLLRTMLVRRHSIGAGQLTQSNKSHAGVAKRTPQSVCVSVVLFDI